jgi:hypothetical protein
MTSGAGIVIPSSLDPAVEFTGSEFDAKVGRECSSDPAGHMERIKRNNGEHKRSNFHGFAATIMTISRERGEPKAAENPRRPCHQTPRYREHTSSDHAADHHGR